MAREGLYGVENPYPGPRTDRGQGIPVVSGQASTLPVPRTFLWSGHVRNAGADTHAIVSSRRVTGPAFLDWLNWFPQLGAGTTRSPKFILGWAPQAITDQNDAADSVLAGITTLYEQDFQDDGGFAAAGRPGLYHTNVATASRDARLGVAIQAPEFFLIAAVRCDAGASAFIVDFTLRVLENVDLDLLADLVAS